MLSNRAATRMYGASGYVPREERWICENPACKVSYAEYVNGCPHCYDNGLYFSVRATLVPKQ